MSDVVAQTGLRHNIRPLLPQLSHALRDTVLAIGGTGSLPLLAARAATEALAVEGLRSDQARALERAVNEAGGVVVVADDAVTALIVAPVAAIATAAARLHEWGQHTQALGAEISRVLMGQASPAPMRCGNYTLPIGERTLIMGIVNVTGDSFSGDGVGGDVGAAVDRAEQLVAEGADIIDIGGESTRPNSTEVPVIEEMQRVLPVVRALAGRLDVPLSIDTRKAEVARPCIAAGCVIVNDVWGLRGDAGMASVLEENAHVALVAMHNQRHTQYGDLMADVARALHESLLIAARHGVAAGRIIVDPGFGFGKTPPQNLELMRRLSELRGLCRPILLGASRKSTIGAVLEGAVDRVGGSVALAALGVREGVDLIRTHDVAATSQALRLADAVVRGTPEQLRTAPSPGPTQ